jgi:MoaA/NifB/PqqE/SkfB family radical SAM enzyme
VRYHDLSTIQEIHAELTNRCNAACPMCSRNVFGGADTPGMEFSEWTAEDGERVFTKELKSLRNVLFCGTHGDPAVTKHSLDIAQTIKRNTGATIEFYSNASVRTPDWWAELGRVLNTKKDDGYYRRSDLGIFSIDGLADTNHLYRRRTNFDKIMENAEAFIKAGGVARWDYIVFKHNEHQVEQAQELAKKMGFKQFRVRKTSRFIHSPDGPDKYRVMNKDGEIEYYLEPPSDERWRNQEIDKFTSIAGQGGLEEYFNTTQITCLNKSQFQRIYVNAFVRVMPCCFLSSDLYPGKGQVYRDTNAKLLERHGADFSSLRLHDWNTVLNHSFFAEELVNSWNTDVAGGRFKRCARTCGAGFSPIKSQSKDHNIARSSGAPSLSV